MTRLLTQFEPPELVEFIMFLGLVVHKLQVRRLFEIHLASALYTLVFVDRSIGRYRRAPYATQ